jgi:hypothetical protein
MSFFPWRTSNNFPPPPVTIFCNQPCDRTRCTTQTFPLPCVFSTIKILFYTLCFNLIDVSIGLLYLTIIFHLKNFFRIHQILTACAQSKVHGNMISSNWVIFKTLPMKLEEILNILLANHENPCTVAMFFNCIKCKWSFKIMKFVKSSWYPMWSLW